MPRAALRLAVLLCAAGPGHAQDSPVGTILVPTEPLVLFDNPPSGLFSTPTATAVAQDRGLGTEIQALMPDPFAPQGYVAAAAPEVAGGGLVVTDFVDVFQGDGLARWVRVVPADQTNAPTLPGGDPVQGWVLLPPEAN